MAKKRTFNLGTTREIPSGQDEPILPVQVANENAGFTSSSRLRNQPSKLGTLSNDDGDGNENGKKNNRFRLAKQQLCTNITLFLFNTKVQFSFSFPEL